MISALTGELRQVDEDRIHLQVGPLLCELLVPAADVPLLSAGVGNAMTFHTIFYIEGDSSGGNMEPRLLGFLRKEDRAFFEKFITVKGIGPKRALKALVMPAGDVARAIENKDTRFLVELPSIGKRMAEQIVAELAGKVKEFAFSGGPEGAPGGRGALAGRPQFEEDAILSLMALGERRADAEHLLERARQHNGNIKTTDGLLREMLRMRTVRT
jgi:Holliday junction DNA helicase RuvA